MADAPTLLLVLPTTERKFHARLGGGDYLLRFAANPSRFWPLYERQVAAPMRSLAEVARAAGADVIEDASLDRVAQATSGATAVIVVSHWKGPLVQVEDLIGEATACWARIVASGAPASKALQRAFRQRVPDASALRAALNAYIEEPVAPLADAAGDVSLATHFTHMSVKRDEIDELLSDLLRPGNRIEFADTMASKEMLAASVAHSFHGILDLTACTSTYLSDYVSRMARGRFLTLQFEKEQEPDLTCLLLERVFQLLTANMTYPEARRAALRDVETALANADVVGKPRGIAGFLSSIFTRK